MRRSEDARWQWIGAAVLVAVVFPFLIGLSHDLARSYTITPDADLIFLGQALRLGDGLGQTYHDHTGHAYILILYAWLKVWAFFGLGIESYRAIIAPRLPQRLLSFYSENRFSGTTTRLTTVD